MFYVYLVLSAALIPFLNQFFHILRESYSWWLVPVLFIGFFIGFLLLHALIFSIFIMAVNINKPADKGAKFYRLLTNLTISLIMKIVRVSVHTKGLDKVPEDGRFLFVCNHQHDFDPIIMMSVFPNYDIGFIGKKEIYKTMPYIGKAMHKLYCLPIDRENDREAVKTILSAVKILKEDKASIGLFPEGYTSKTCELLPMRNGAFKIAYKANVPIVVCVINNTRAIQKNLFLRHTDVEFRVLNVIYPDEFVKMSTVQLGDIIQKEMKTALDEIRK